MGRSRNHRGLILVLAVMGLGCAESASAGPPGTRAVTDTVETTGRAEIPVGRGGPLPEGFLEERRGGARIARKLAVGTLGGAVGGLWGSAAGAALASATCEPGEGGETFGCGFAALMGAVVLGPPGFAVGAAVGVSQVDPHDRFLAALAGSAAGLTAGIYLTLENAMLWPNLFAGPVLMATMTSEWFRDSPYRRLSLRLSPTPGRGVSAAASLRF